MRTSDQVAALEPFENMLVVSEVATFLGVKPGRIHAMIEDGSLLSRYATLQETAQLLASGRIKGVPGSGIRLIPHYAAALAADRRKRGWPKGLARKKA
ncbi:hypothetical protein [Tengunoibacter tsumagoiensis]|uniref:Helix-turn-helix domain-containing protein n=1 Tax=Tengunoibacter tsumagoiensis TaxID=2014871 RepID=A0A402A5V1_9CHLR|nr:hypothetical protein [Tengunoibacter tsumagoiensis]GCE14459.1 hypothetical protein KTT_43180 [Tengunoibacter tsumagoiensis]